MPSSTVIDVMSKVVNELVSEVVNEVMSTDVNNEVRDYIPLSATYQWPLPGSRFCRTEIDNNEKSE